MEWKEDGVLVDVAFIGDFRITVAPSLGLGYTVAISIKNGAELTRFIRGTRDAAKRATPELLSIYLRKQLRIAERTDWKSS